MFHSIWICNTGTVCAMQQFWQDPSAKLASLLVESIQLVSKLGSFDVDDIMLNTLGGILGYVLFRCCNAILHIWKKKRNSPS